MRAQLFIDTLRLTWFTTHTTRGYAIAGAFDNQYAYWENGEIEFDDLSGEFTTQRKRLEAGLVPDWLEVAKAEAREFADEFTKGESIREGGERNGKSRDWWHRYWSARSNYLEKQKYWPWPKLWHPMYWTAKFSAINNIPDDITDEWLALAVETCQAMMRAKIDFTSWTIWDEGHIKHKLKMARLQWANGLEGYLEDLRRRDEWNVKHGLPTRARHKAKLAADPEWTDFHSPEARAERANHDHREVRKHGEKLLGELRERFPGRVAT